MDKATANPPPRKAEHRRSNRFPVVVPVEVKCHEPSGVTIKKAAQAKEVNAEGGLLDMKTYPDVGSQIELTNLLSTESAQARVVAIRRSQKGAVLGVAVELLVPNETFWGLNFRLRRASAELVKLEQGIKSGGIDPRILREFRDSVDYVRKTAWAVQEWQERQLQQRNTSTVLPLLTVERIRRATQLSNAITMDLAAHEVTCDTAGIEDLFRAIERVYQNLLSLFKNHETQYRMGGFFRKLFLRRTRLMRRVSDASV